MATIQELKDEMVYQIGLAETKWPMMIPRSTTLEASFAAGTQRLAWQQWSDLVESAIAALAGRNFMTIDFAYKQWLGQMSDAVGTVSMDQILNGMLTADFEQLQKFVGIVDAYRSAVWDQPFNAEFYAALARGFRP